MVLALVVHPGDPEAAEGRPADCELTVLGKTFIKGVCQFSPGTGGGFQISSGDYFAYVDVTAAGVADASWNANPRSTHAQAPLGTLKRKGACWVGPGATICARELPAGKAKVLTASQPDGAGLFPVLPGMSACLGTEGPLQAGKPVVLRDCRVPADLIFVPRGDGTLNISKRPELCLAVEAPGMSKPARLIIDHCRPDQTRWILSAPASEGAVVRSSEGLCLTIPQVDVPDAVFPFAVHARPCASLGAKATKFLLSKG